tara:strand:- start:3911 stop:4165 length:255 start_codon:yes stop_codon:yes gene_type:complete
VLNQHFVVVHGDIDMRVMSKEQSEILDKLTKLAYGDFNLVEEAITACSAGTMTAPLAEVIAYIERRRVNPNDNSAQQEKIAALA